MIEAFKICTTKAAEEGVKIVVEPQGERGNWQ
jgi:hypothetical protein